MSLWSNGNVKEVHVIGGGLAGSEATWQLVQSGVPVVLHEMRPVRKTDAHDTDGLAELVCSNSFRSDDAEYNAVGLLHQEMRRCNSLILRCGDDAKLPAGGALAVDREEFRQPGPALCQPGDIAQMDMDIAAAGMDCPAVRFTLTQKSLHNLFVDEVEGDLVVELDVKPLHQAAHLCPRDRALTQKGGLFIHLVQIFTDGLRARDAGPILVDQNRYFARRVQCQEMLVPFPDFLNLEVEVEFLLAKHEAYFSAERV